VNARDKDGVTALILASATVNLDVVQTLIAEGADVNAKNNGKAAALSLAKSLGHNDVAQLLIKAGAKE
jgi:uncharacterized protein